MISFTALLCLLGASIALTVAPGPDNLFVLTQGISRGRKAAVVTAWGMCSGITVHTLAAALGISAVFYSSAVAFQIVKYAGAAYLLYLAFRALREHKTTLGGKTRDPQPGIAYYRRGFIMNVLNPKVALFFLAFLPQFTTPDASNVALQMIVLGVVFMLQAVVIFTAIALFSGSLGNYLIQNPQVARYFAWLSSGIFASLGIRLALVRR